MLAWQYSAAFYMAALGAVIAYTPGVDFLDGIDYSCLTQIRSDYSSCETIELVGVPGVTATVQDVVSDGIISRKQSGACYSAQQECRDRNKLDSSCYQTCNPFACCLGELAHFGLCTDLEIAKKYPCVKVLPCYQACDDAQTAAWQPCTDLANKCYQDSVNDGCAVARKDYSCSGKLSSVSVTTTTSTSTTSSARPSTTCRNFYRYQSCPVPYSSKCLSRTGRKLVRGIEPTYNGCGALADDLQSSAVRVALDTFGGQFQDSCNNHDICFGTCSFGDDSQFDDCNLNFLSQMLADCKRIYPVNSGSVIGNTVNSIKGAECVSQAVFVYSAVQEKGCSAYESAQIQACVCVDCDGVPMETRTISTVNPVTNAATAFKGSAPDIAADWIDFITSLGSAITDAGTSLLGQALTSFANQIGYQSPTPSGQIKALAALSGGVNRRAMLGDHRRQNTRRLSSYFTSLNLDSDALYGCAGISDQSVCTTAIALLSIARIARALDQYGIDHMPPSNVSSSISASQTQPSSTSSSDVTAAPESTESMSIVLGSSSSTTPIVSESQTSAPSSYISGIPSPAASSTVSPVSVTTSPTTSSSGITPTEPVCNLVKVYGDSPDSPDSPDGVPEIPEIPDYPGGYYYLCSDGSIPPLSILPPINGLTSSTFSRSTGTPTSAAAETASRASDQTSLNTSTSCALTKIYGDSPDTPDTPDSPDGQPEIPEIPETSQDPEDGAYYWGCK